MFPNPYFKESEFVCKCGKCQKPANVPGDKLLNALIEIRELYQSPVVINSGYRCEEHNKKVGGAAKSQHSTFGIKTGGAADFVVKGVKTEEVFQQVMRMFKDKGFGIAIKRNKANPYAGFVHLDTRGVFATWEYP
ncbi:D-Ala-D-Ala carboxypeptidase family metallohydrolase [Helicobacter sp. MIT 05-5294]|uniref:D-Ala-D-Ala carboxypeptidase family metallohydrolase n=1 Tax=Helicobacter sp. MIT 05-5294 TaxID=1548150 RepID=UPI00051FB2FB|nr:D-Ala-D-Ala carboxypeptidase family metallohydrolase [Helicobacter sp. MIT 05-5294]TLD85784.1 DUF882 domain-containing protein [Helicobacter sp. MIT 05-5294]